MDAPAGGAKPWRLRVLLLFSTWSRLNNRIHAAPEGRPGGGAKPWSVDYYTILYMFEAQQQDTRRRPRRTPRRTGQSPGDFEYYYYSLHVRGSTTRYTPPPPKGAPAAVQELVLSIFQEIPASAVQAYLSGRRSGGAKPRERQRIILRDLSTNSEGKSTIHPGSPGSSPLLRGQVH